MNKYTKNILINLYINIDKRTNVLHNVVEVIFLKEEKMHLINKIFNNKTIRTVWDKENEKYYVSIVDIVGILADSKEPRKYWNWFKNKLRKEEDFEVSSITRQLKLKAQDGKYRETDVTDIEGMFRIIESIPSKNAEPVKMWLAKLGKERIDEIFDPTISVQRAIELYRAKGYDEDWIARRIKSLQERKKLTDVWKDNGIETSLEYALLTNEIYKEWSGMTAKEYKEYKGIRKENLRDNMTDIEVLLTDIGEVTTKELAKKHKPQGFNANKKVAKIGGEVAKNTRKDIEEELGESVISKENSLNYKYLDVTKQLQENKDD